MGPQHKDPIFKGAKDPATMFGVPTLPFIIVVGVFLLGIVWMFVLVGKFAAFIMFMAMVLSVLVMRYISADDPHRLNQWVLWLRGSASRRNSEYWGAASRSPVDYKRR